MDWLRLAFMTARSWVQPPKEPISSVELEHSLDERWEPTQEVISESLGAGNVDTNLTKDSLIVSNRFALFSQCKNHNSRLQWALPEVNQLGVLTST